MKGLKRSPYKFKVTMLTFGESKFKKCGKKDKDSSNEKWCKI